MANGQSEGLDQLVGEVVRAVAPDLTGGLGAEQAAWAENAYRDLILPHRLRFAASEGPTDRQARAQIVVESIRSDVAMLSPTAKWDYIVSEYYLTRLWPLSEAAFELARVAFQGTESRDDLVKAAEANYSELRAIADEVEEWAPEALERLGRLISESVLDYEFALHGGNITSLRLGRYVRAVSEPDPSDDA
jgi:hypothetical protein